LGGAPTPSGHERFGRSLFVRVSFEVRTETTFGDTVVIVGETPQLGGWEPERGITMSTSEENYPIWRVEPLLLSEHNNGDVEFKFVVLGADGHRWEPLPHNRRLALGGEEVQVIADWGSLDSLPPRTGRGGAPPLPSVVEQPSEGISICASHRRSSGQLTPIASCSSPTAAPAAAATAAGSAGSSASAVAAADALTREASGGPSARLLVVQHQLPFNVSRTPDGTWWGSWDDGSLLATSVQGGRHLMGSLDLEVVFIGVPKLPAGSADLDAQEQAALQSLLREKSCIAVFLPSQLSSAHCSYSFTVLWPLLHNQVPDQHAGGQGGDGALVSSWWKGYVASNEAFASIVKQSLRAGDMVWVHSHPLLLVPSALRQARWPLGAWPPLPPLALHLRAACNTHPRPAPSRCNPLEQARIPASCTVSFFLHTPFPSPEVWRVLPHRTQLLQGLLASHVIGFHLFEYARHFMTSCRRLLALGENVGAGPAGGVLSIDLGSRRATITVSHVGIDCEVIRHRLGQPEVTQQRSALVNKRPDLRGRTILGGVEMLNKQQGVALKLLAFEQLLVHYPPWRTKLALLQVALRDLGRPEESAIVSAECVETVRRIRSSYGDACVEYLEMEGDHSWSVYDRLALFSLSHVYLNCATRDGLNLLPFEYVLTKSVLRQDGVVVLSEFVGCSHVLNGGVRVNPFNLEHVVEQLDAALSMPADERRARLQKDINFVLEHTTASWLKMAVNDMHRVRSADAASQPAAAAPQPTRALCSWAAGVRAGEPLPPLSLDMIARAYRTACRRVVLLGLDGTLIQQHKVMAHLKNYHDFTGKSLSPPPAALHCLRALCSDPQNAVYVISGRTSQDMEACLGNIAGLGLAAENGYLQRPPRCHANEPPWYVNERSQGASDEVSWRELAQPVLARYTSRTNGSYMRWQQSAVQWCYFDADPDFGRFQAQLLCNRSVTALEPLAAAVYPQLFSGTAAGARAPAEAAQFRRDRLALSGQRSRRGAPRRCQQGRGGRWRTAQRARRGSDRLCAVHRR